MSVSTFTGAKAIGPAAVTATTGSPTVDTTSRPGKTIYKFTGSGTITVGNAGMAEVLVVGGGGAGCVNNGAPGGAGGVIYNSNIFLPAGSMTVTVGAGGAGGPYTQTSVSGNTSRLGNLYSIGGGGGGNDYGYDGKSGGSGGGGERRGAGGSAVTGQGYPGGAGYNSSPYRPGGGGGAGGPGANATSGGPGARGAGVLNSITGTSITYAQGGGWDTGNGADYTGTGGGAKDPSSAPYLNGGSGIVVVVIG